MADKARKAKELPPARDPGTDGATVTRAGRTLEYRATRAEFQPARNLPLASTV